jgi:hypothetical protein
MIVDPVDALKKTSSHQNIIPSVFPTSALSSFLSSIKPTSVLSSLNPSTVYPSATASATPVLPIPSVVPDPVERQLVGESGSRTLWVVFVIMVIASAVFAAWSWRVPVVSCPDGEAMKALLIILVPSSLPHRHHAHHHLRRHLLLRHGYRSRSGHQ